MAGDGAKYRRYCADHRVDHQRAGPAADRPTRPWLSTALAFQSSWPWLATMYAFTAKLKTAEPFSISSACVPCHTPVQDGQTASVLGQVHVGRTFSKTASLSTSAGSVHSRHGRTCRILEPEFRRTAGSDPRNLSLSMRIHWACPTASRPVSL